MSTSVPTPRRSTADEPTGNLDPKARSTVVDSRIRAARETGTTTDIVPHDPWIAERCDLDYTLKKGRITKSIRRGRSVHARGTSAARSGAAGPSPAEAIPGPASAGSWSASRPAAWRATPSSVPV